MKSDINGLAGHLVSRGYLSEQDARRAMQSARHELNSFVEQCIANRLVNQAILAAAIARVFGLPLLDLARCRPRLEPAKIVGRKLMERHGVLPLGMRGNRLVLAVADPGQSQAIREVEFHTGKSADLVIASHDQLLAAIRSLDQAGKDPIAPASPLDLEPIPGSQDFARIETGHEEVGDAPMIHTVNRILLEAINQKASDIHVEPYEKLFRVRIRVDGILREFSAPPIHLANRLISRLKIMAHLDISERRLPQDGRIKFHRHDQQPIDLRVSILPTLWGEKAVLRVLDPHGTRLDLDQLGFRPDQAKLVREGLARPQGMILVTGPTGSGKTVTLYSAMARLNDSSRNISTAEDPVELNLAGINQVQIRPSIGLDFATALRAFLRQDPDVIMVGEIRDRDTAEIAVKAAQTGHLVLSTLHTNSAAETLTRLLSMGVETYDLISSLSLIIAQRLARKLCEKCRKPARLGPEMLEKLELDRARVGTGRIFQAAGCDSCHEGYRGRIGIYEVVPISTPMSRTIIAAGNSMDIAEQARQAGYPSLRQSAVTRMTEGLISPEEVIRVT